MRCRIGQFTQIDPIGLAGGLNLYGYANGDPVNFDDPFGLCPIPHPAAQAACQQLAQVASRAGPSVSRLASRAGPAASAYGQRFTAFYGNLANTIGARLNNLVGHVTEREHLSFTAREAAGKVQSLKASGVPHDHVKETVERMSGVRNLLPRIEKALGDPRVQGEVREQFNQLMSKASKALDAMERAVQK